MDTARGFNGDSRDHRRGELCRVVVNPVRKQYSAMRLAEAKADKRQFIDDADPEFLIEENVPRYSTRLLCKWLVHHYRHYAARYYNILHKTNIKCNVQIGSLPNDLLELSRITERAQTHFHTLSAQLEANVEARDTAARRYGSGRLKRLLHSLKGAFEDELSARKRDGTLQNK